MIKTETKSGGSMLASRANSLYEQLAAERARPSDERMLLYEADLETDLRITLNDIRKLEGKDPIYFTI